MDAQRTEVLDVATLVVEEHHPVERLLEVALDLPEVGDLAARVDLLAVEVPVPVEQPQQLLGAVSLARSVEQTGSGEKFRIS